jgi:hypothetical protein
MKELDKSGFVRFTSKVKKPSPHGHCDLTRLTWHHMYEHLNWTSPEKSPTSDWEKWDLVNGLLH